MTYLLTGRRVLAIILILVGAAMLRETYTAQSGFLADSIGMGPMTYPRYLLFGWLACSVLFFILPEHENGFESISKSYKAIIRATSLIVAYVIMFQYLGLLLSSIFFLIAFFIAEGYRNVKLGIVVAISFSFVFWFTFEKILKVSMPEGFISFF